MKRTAFLLVAAALLAFGCSRTQKFTISSDLESAHFPQSDSVLVTSELLHQPVIAPVTDGTYTLIGEVEKPAFATLNVLNGSRESIRSLILEKGTISFEDGFAVGTPLNDSNRNLVMRLREIRTAGTGDKKAVREAIDAEFIAYVTKHKNDPCAIFAILLANRRVSPETLQKMISIASPEIRNNGEIRSLSNRLKKMEQERKLMEQEKKMRESLNNN